MKLNYEEFIEKHKDVIETGKPNKEFLKDLYEIIEVINEGEKTSFIITLHKLMVEILKYQYDINYQNREEIYKIMDLVYEVKKIKSYSQDAYNKVTEDEIKEIYKESVKVASYTSIIDKNQIKIYNDNFSKETLSKNELVYDKLLYPYATGELKNFLEINKEALI